MNKVFGWCAGMAIGLVVIVAVPTLHPLACVLLGFGLSMAGVLLGTIADERR